MEDIADTSPCSESVYPRRVPTADLHIESLPPETRAAAQAVMDAGESENTKRSYQTALAYWSGWHLFSFGRPLDLPTPIVVLVQFVLDHLAVESVEGAKYQMKSAVEQQLMEAGLKAQPGALKLSTIKHRIAVLSKVHELRGFDPNPCKSAELKALLHRSARVLAKEGKVTTQKHAATRTALAAILDTCDDSLIGVRDRAILLVGWSSGGRRRSELAALHMSHLELTHDDTYLIRMTRSKTNQAGESRIDKPIRGTAALALTQWIESAEIDSGYVFRRLDGGRIGESLTGRSISNMVTRRAKQAGLNGDFSAHSLRSGFVTEAGAKRVSLGDVMALTEHKSVSSVMRYYRAGEVAHSQVGNLFDWDGL